MKPRAVVVLTKEGRRRSECIDGGGVEEVGEQAA
jgi:hypothetical protein